MKRAYYSNSIAGFVDEPRSSILGQLVAQSEFAVEQTQRDAWIAQVDGLKSILSGHSGAIYFEWTWPKLRERLLSQGLVRLDVFR